MQQKRFNWMSLLVVGIISGGISVMVFSFMFKEPEARVEIIQPSNNHYATMPVSSAISTDFTEAAQKSVDAVVHVMTKRMVNSPYVDIMDLLLGRENVEQRPVEGSGSGVIISEDGYIVTNNHVIDKSDEIIVVLNDKRKFTAKLVGTDPFTDIALLRIDADDLQPLSFGNSDVLKLGEWVLAVGNPFSLSTTVTAGIVSAKSRSIGILSSGQNGNRLGIEAFIQTDAAVNPGNSGGALVNTRGELIGINSAIASPTGAYAGYSFAVPAGIVKKVVSDLMEYGELQRAYLGIELYDISADFAAKKEIALVEGVYVSNVLEESGAKEAGVKEGDIVVNVNGTKVKTSTELIEQISRYRPGDRVSVTVLRDKKEKVLAVTLKNEYGGVKMSKRDDSQVLGATLKTISPNLKEKIGLNSGIQIVSLDGGKLKKYGVREGYIITRINNRPVSTVEDVKMLVAKALESGDQSGGALFISGMYPDGKRQYYAINLEDGN